MKAGETAADKLGKAPAEAPVKTCRHCSKSMPVSASFCTECNKYQSWWKRWLDGFGVSTLISSVPLLAIVFVFLQDRVVVARSDVGAVPLKCDVESVTMGFSNAGTRAAILASGQLAVMEGAKSISARDLTPAGGAPLVLDRGKTAVAAFDLKHSKGFEVGGLEDVVAGRTCTYRMTLDIREFDNDQPRNTEVSCACPK